MVEPWMFIAAGLVVIAGVFVAVTWRFQRPAKPRGEDVPPAPGGEGDITFHNLQTNGTHNAGGTPAPRRTGGPPMQPQTADESLVIRTDPRGQEVLGTQRRDAHALEDARAAGTKILDRLVADVKSHADKRVSELDVLIAQARRHVEELQRQSAELAKTLQTARNEAARRQAAAIERAAVARAIADCETLSAAIAASTAANLNATNHAAIQTTTTTERADTWPIPVPRPAIAAATRPAPPEGTFIGGRHREVLRLLDQNHPPLEISRTLGLEIGEVELIANLNGRRRENAGT